jgi:cell shape-determining protein MreC
MEELWKTDAPNLYRDPNTGAIINNNVSEYKKIVQARQQAIESQQMAKEVDSLKEELRELKNLLAQLVNGKH